MQPTDSPGAALVREANRASMLMNGDRTSSERQAPVAGIDPQEFGRLEAEVAALRRDNDRLMVLMERFDTKLENIESKLSEARGGWRALMLIGGASAAMGGTLMGFAQKVFKVLG